MGIQMQASASKGLALLEVILSVVVVTVAIAILINLQSGSSHQKAITSSARNVSVLINESLETQLVAFTDGNYQSGYEDTCSVDFNSFTIKCTKDNTVAPDASAVYLQDLKKMGVQSFKVQVIVEGDNDA